MYRTPPTPHFVRWLLCAALSAASCASTDPAPSQAADSATAEDLGERGDVNDAADSSAPPDDADAAPLNETREDTAGVDSGGAEDAALLLDVRPREDTALNDASDSIEDAPRGDDTLPSSDAAGDGASSADTSEDASDTSDASDASDTNSDCVTPECEELLCGSAGDPPCPSGSYCDTFLVPSICQSIVPVLFSKVSSSRSFLSYPRDVLEFAKNGATSLHCSEELWRNPLQVTTGMNKNVIIIGIKKK